MQPLENKRTKTQTGVARARLLFKRDLAWLPGYPLDAANDASEAGNAFRWQSNLTASATNSSANSSAVSIDGEQLRRAQMTISKLRHRFPRALPKVVDDVDDWLSRTDFLLGLLKGWVHHGETFSSDDVLRSGILPTRWTDELVRIGSSYPRLDGLLNAVTFLTLSDRQNCAIDALEWIDRHATELALLCEIDPERSCELPIRMLSVRETLSSDLMKVFTRCFTDPLVAECRWKRSDARLRELRDEVIKATKQNEFIFPEPKPDETLAQLVMKAFDQACLARPKQQRDCFRLLEHILTAELIEDIAQAQRQITTSEEEMCKLLRRFTASPDMLPQTKANQRELRKQVAESTKIAAVPISTVAAMGTCLGMLSKFTPPETRLWIDFLAGFPREHAGLSARLLAKWWSLWQYRFDHQKDFMRVIKVLSGLMRRRGVAPSILAHWYRYVDEKNVYCELVVNSLDELSGSRDLEKRLVRLLEKVVYDLPLNLGNELLSSMICFAKTSDDDPLSCSLIEHLAKKSDREYDETDLRLAYHFGDSLDLISEILIALQSDYELTELATQLKPLAVDRDLKLIVAKRLAGKDVRLLSRIAATTTILCDMQHPLPKRNACRQVTNWRDRYPTELNAALDRLGQVTLDASKIAESVLGKWFPSSEKLQHQIDALESKLAAGVPNPSDKARMQGRLANLRARQTQAPSVSPARCNKLVEKLQQRTDLEILQQYAKASRAQAVTAMQQRFNLNSLAEDWLQPPLDRVVREINRLSSPMQELGVRLLFETLERTTRNFDLEPGNVAFRKRMETAGVLMQPWLSDQVKQTATTADGSDYELAFTRDVIDFLLMGFHFDTCLSPDSFNFFSTVANAVDLNKRVVYAKTQAGKVIGRCLFALNDAGEILTYHRYSHDPKDGFAGAVDQFAQQLASQMQTSIATTGKVSKLVAKQWYDDGPWQTESNWLGDDGLLAKLVKEFPSEELLPALLDAKGRDFLKPRVAELAMDVRVRRQPKFLIALLDELEGEMSVRQKFTVAVNIDCGIASHRLLSQLRWSDIVGLVNRHQCNECDVFHGIAEYQKVFAVLTEYHPSLALRAIRASRPSSIKNDASDPNRTRRDALAKVHRMLGREHLANKLTNCPENKFRVTRNRS
ncbi:hypothetical protein LF1_38840 [Rubripirellula obstinata]|uniref:Uncharacterized protein n=1 Tax=Rubripirellula obstinata TaxID=406547 RepID=A0A5B1CJI1_9BACT|nr:hypothetical protein [Rubripirellula obstinata]KAA1261337.1 hypothetical protein LF1_38840 [Rubripirellula obstinata]